MFTQWESGGRCGFIGGECGGVGDREDEGGGEDICQIKVVIGEDDMNGQSMLCFFVRVVGEVRMVRSRQKETRQR